MTFLITGDLLGLEVAGRAAGVTVAVLAAYQACGLLARASFYVSDALADAVFPFIARSASLRDKHRWFMAAARWVPLLIIPIQAALFAAPGPVLRLFLPQQYSYPAAHALLRALAAGTLAALMTDMLVKSLFAAGRERQAGRRMPITVVTEVTGLIVLVPRYGAVGAAYSFLLASCVGLVLLTPLYLRTVQARLPSAARLASYAIGFAPTAAIFAVAGRAPVTLAWAPWVLILAGALAFVVPARRMRLITDTDIRFLKGLGSRRRRAAWHADVWLAVFCACVAAVALLYNISTSPDILYDEAAYTWAAQQVAQEWHLTLNTQPLFVHPPLMFLVQAAWLRVTGYASAPLASAIRTARLLAASIGVADVLLIAGLAYRLAGHAGPRRRRVITALTAVIAALDPVLTRYDRQDVIEPFALCAGLLTLHAAWGLRDRRALTYVSVTGLLGGLALLTNEITVFLVAVPPLFALLERNRPLFRRSLAAFGIAVAFLGLFLVWAAELGLGGSFVNIQTATLRRLLGLVQITGLNVPGVSLVSAVGRSIGHYSSSYIVLLAGFAAMLWCWGRRNTSRGNFVTAWLTASHGAAAYIVAVGTLNEQFFVYLLPASIVGTVLVTDAIVAARARRRARAVVAAGLHGPRGPVRRRVGQQLHRRKRRGGAGHAVHRYHASGLRRRQRQRGPRQVLLPAGGTHLHVLLGGCRCARRRRALLPAVAGRRHRARGQHEPGAGELDHRPGQRLAEFPSQVYGTVQLWYVPASPYDPVADVSRHLRRRVRQHGRFALRRLRRDRRTRGPVLLGLSGARRQGTARRSAEPGRLRAGRPRAVLRRHGARGIAARRPGGRRAAHRGHARQGLARRVPPGHAPSGPAARPAPPRGVSG